MEKHLHRYRRVNIGHDGKEYWVMRCSKPQCSHYTPMSTKLSAPLLRGSLAECSRCKTPFLLNKRALRMESPCCEDCVVRKITDKIKEADQFFEELERDMLK